MSSKNLFNLNKKCAVVIGGNGKLGKSIVEALNDCGATVFVLSSNISNSKKIKSGKKKILELAKDRLCSSFSSRAESSSSKTAVRPNF